MTRRNISLPEDLNARLDRVRDRINVSKVCAAALERELERIEGHMTMTGVDEERVQRMLTRLQRQHGSKEQWYARGRRAGQEWAEQVATIRQLGEIDEEWEDLDGMTLEDLDPEEVASWYDEMPDECRAEEIESQLEDIDELFKAAYVLGWHTGVRTLWRAVRPRL